MKAGVPLIAIEIVEEIHPRFACDPPKGESDVSWGEIHQRDSGLIYWTFDSRCEMASFFVLNVLNRCRPSSCHVATQRP